MELKEITEREVRKIKDQINYLQDECNWMKRAVRNYQDTLGKIEIELEKKEIKSEINDLESKCIMEKKSINFFYHHLNETEKNIKKLKNKQKDLEEK